MKKKIFNLTLIASVFFLSSCVKKVLESTFDSVQCAESYSELAQAEASDNCPGTVENINSILDSCSAFLSQAQKDELLAVKAECEGN